MDKKIERAVLKTLVYSDIFDYPLSKDELWKFLIGKKIDKKIFIEFLKDLNLEKIYFKNNLYFLYGRDKIVDVRIKRRKESQKKMAFARKIIKKLTFLPTVQFIGISGALSLENSSKEDDIDLFVIASRGSLWLTRLAMIILLMLMGRYRGRNQNEVSDKICLNMLIDDSALLFRKVRQNLYTAHEVIQMIPVFERNDMYKKFMTANKWVEKFLPNAFVDRGTKQNRTSRQTRLARLTVPQNNLRKGFRVFPRIVQRFSALENLAKMVQLWSIKKHLTTETIRNGFLAFHPFDYKKDILKEYNKRLIRYEV